MKTQAIRLADVFALGPFMVYAACKDKLTANERFVLGLSGIATILYNGANFIREAKAPTVALIGHENK